MLKKIGSFIVLLLFLIFVSGVLFFAYNLYAESIKTETVQTVKTGNETITVEDGATIITKTRQKSFGETITEIFTTKEPEVISYSEDKSIGKYFYEQLNGNQKAIYNGLQENMDKLPTGTYSIEFGNKFHDTLEQENGGDKLGDDYQSAIEAFTHDNTDLFYIDISKMYLNMETNKKAFKTTYNVYIKPLEGDTYFAKGFTSENQVRDAIQKVQEVRDAIKAKATGDTYKDVKMIHDYLINNISYDSNYQSLSPYTIYGALVEKRCVCEGYAKAFKYLSDAVGIKCIMMQGTATNNDGTTENHAWNAVLLKGIWYQIDTTWDDPIIVGKGYVSEKVHYKYFLKGTGIFEKDHQLEKQFTDNGKIFDFPILSTRDY